MYSYTKTFPLKVSLIPGCDFIFMKKTMHMDFADRLVSYPLVFTHLNYC